MDEQSSSSASDAFQLLVRSLAETPERVRSLLEGLGEAACGWKPAVDEFSAKENVCHLRDIEEEGYSVRIRRLLYETEPTLEDLDGARLARERDYNSQDMLAALERFHLARSANVDAVKSLPPASLNRSGRFEGTGAITLGGLLLMMREHDQSHLKELEALRARLQKMNA